MMNDASPDLIGKFKEDLLTSIGGMVYIIDCLITIIFNLIKRFGNR